MSFKTYSTKVMSQSCDIQSTDYTLQCSRLSHFQHEVKCKGAGGGGIKQLQSTDRGGE